MLKSDLEKRNPKRWAKKLDALSRPVEGLTEWDQQAYLKIISVDLTEEQKRRVIAPAHIYPRQDDVIALHWHPEFVPMELIAQRVNATFPHKKKELIIPTNHNTLMSYDGCYSGTEIDCYSQSFNRKVQLLLHFENSRLEKADVLKSMLAHTLEYRSGQLFELIDSVVEPGMQHRLEEAVKETGAYDGLVLFVQVHTRKLKSLFLKNESITPAHHVKNKLLSDYFLTLLDHYDEWLINHALSLIKAVKQIVKREFSMEYFYRTEEVIEEARKMGGCIVVPHPEQFWPILLAEYDVDGYEVWNPQSREFTEFLINVVNRQNKTRKQDLRPLLLFMGDDTHMSEKIKHAAPRDNEKVRREVGVQTPWDDPMIRKSLITANLDRSKLIEEYKSRLL